MKSLDGLNYYEILQIPASASFLEIKRAYREALSIYSEDSLATYCLFTDDERECILTIIETAFLTLIDKDKRADYDRGLVESGQNERIHAGEDQYKTIPYLYTDNLIHDEEVTDSVSDVCGRVRSAYRQEIIQTIDTCTKNIKDQRINIAGIKNLHKLNQMKEKAHDNRNLYEIEQELLTMSEVIKEPAMQIRRSASTVTIVYTLIACIGYILLNITDTLMLRSFNIPFTVLLMGLLGCLVRMYLQLPTLGKRQPMSPNPVAWFIISPPIAVIMAGLFYGISMIFLSLIQVDLYDESWLFWVQAWIIGLINWVNLFSGKPESLKLSYT